MLTAATPEAHETPIPHYTYGPDLAVLGRQRPTFGGTDALAMNINPKAIAYLHKTLHKLVIGEGDRLANTPFFDAARQTGHLQIIYLDVPPALAQHRMLQRAHQTGNKPQQPQWWKGRHTKVLRLAQSPETVRLDATRPPNEVATDLAAILQRNCDICDVLLPS